MKLDKGPSECKSDMLTLSPVHTKITLLKTYITNSVILKSYTICEKNVMNKKKSFLTLLLTKICFPSGKLETNVSNSAKLRPKVIAENTVRNMFCRTWTSRPKLKVENSLVCFQKLSITVRTFMFATFVITLLTRDVCNNISNSNIRYDQS